MNEEGEAVRFIDREAFAPLLAELEARRYELIGPTVRDGTIVLDRIDCEMVVAEVGSVLDRAETTRGGEAE